MAPIAIVAIFATTSELRLIRLDSDAETFLSASFLGIVLVAVLYGPGPALILGILASLTGWIRVRETLSAFCVNLANYCWYPVLASLSFSALRGLTGTNSTQLVFYFEVFAAFFMALAANLVGVLLPRTRDPREIVILGWRYLEPVLSAELFSALLTLVAVLATVRLGLVGLISFGIVFVIFQYLVGELLTSRRRSAKLRRIATTDELTGLANRDRFHHRVEEAIERGGAFCVLLMDLDRFKEVNDTLGHLYGDRLLQDLGPRLVGAIGESGLVARLGGDEFGILLPEDGGDRLLVETAVATLLGTVAAPFAVDELALEVGASLGVARFPADGRDSHALLRCADIAMYAAKEAQVDYKFYDADQNAHTVQRLNVLSDMRHALSGEDIVVHYQPIVDVETGTVTGAEGLVRWNHPEHGLIPPGGFVQTVEQTGLIGPLTRHVLGSAIAECARWRAGGRELSVAVNLSVRNLLDHDLPREIERLLDLHSLPADALQLEITESMIMSDPERALLTVGRLSELGARLSVDDFGTGYSSLAKLRKLPIDELKIDRSFVSPMLRDESDLIIVRSTINLGHDLGLKIIAEGVEDGDTLARLGALGCDLAQGFHMSRPLPAEAFADWLAESPVPAGAAQKSAV